MTTPGLRGLKAKTTANCVPDFLLAENQPRAFSRRDRTANRKMRLRMCDVRTCPHPPMRTGCKPNKKIAEFLYVCLEEI